MMSKLQLKLVRILLTFSFMLFLKSSVFSFSKTNYLFDIEKNFKSANNDQDYLVVKKQDWETFKENIFTERKKNLDSQDSLSKIIDMHIDSLIRINNGLNQSDKPINQSAKVSYFPWILAIVFGLLVLFISFYLARIYSKMKDANELYIEVENRYEKSKKYWIEVERQLKRELIDAKMKLEESTKNKS